MIAKKMCLLMIVFFQFLLHMDCKAEERSKEEISYFFDDVLLIINFNNPHYDNIEFLKEIYSPYFKNIVFYGEQPHPEVNVVANFQGWFVHRTISHAMKTWPNFKGYICCQDDCFMNFWNYPRLDKDKIWLHQYWTSSLDVIHHPSWGWWNYPCGQAALVQTYEKLPNRARQNLEANCGPRSFAYSWADFVYIPRAYRKKFIRLSQCFDNPEVFIEIAIPSIVLCLEKYENIEHLNPYWAGTINSVNLETYQTHFDWIHPIKLSSQDNRRFIRQLMLDMFPPHF